VQEQIRVQSIEEAEQHIGSLNSRVEELERMVSDMDQRFDTLQSPLWMRIWFRIDGWPGQTNLNADRRSWRPWHVKDH